MTTTIQPVTFRMGRGELPTPAEELELAARRDRGDSAAREELIIRNMPLAVWLARKAYARSPSLPMDDMIGHAFVGLCRAADGYDPDRGVRFGTYAARSILRTIKSATIDEPRLVRVPRYLAYAATDGRPRNPEIDRAASLARTISTGSEGHRGPDVLLFLASACEDDDEDAARRLAMLDPAIGRLPEGWARAVRLRFGLDDGVFRLNREVGAILGVSSSRAQRIVDRACRRLREIMDRIEATS